MPGTSLAVRPGIFPRAKSPRYARRHGRTTAISVRAADDPRQHARQWRAVADVSCWSCHHRTILSAEPWPDDVLVPAPRLTRTPSTA